MRRRRSALATSLALVAGLALSACGALSEGGDGGSDAKEEAPGTVKVGYLHTIAVDDKLHYGLLNGQFEDEGLHVKATQFDTGIAVSQALASGDIDVAIMGGVTSNFPAKGQGKVFMVNSIETATARLFVKKGSGIRSVKDLPGHTLTTTEGTTADIFLNAATKKAGVERAQIDVVNSPMPNAVQAFVAGKVDAIALWVPFDLRVQEAGTGAVEIDNAGNYPDAAVADGWIANNAWYDAHKETIIKLIRAWLEINDAYRAHPDVALAQVQKEAYEGQATLADLKHQVAFQKDYTNAEWIRLYESGHVLDVVGKAEQAFVDLGGLDQWVDPKGFFDTSLFLQVAKARQ